MTDFKTENIPEPVSSAILALKQAGYEAFIVGGCVRDLLLGRLPKDWDICTVALPGQILQVFPSAKYENDFGTVLVSVDNPDIKFLEITTYRNESNYNDFRHPDSVNFVQSIEEDLARRDFTVNAMAMDLSGQVVDIFGGQKDLKLKIIRAVGEPMDRFKEDALRMMRAVRFACQLGFAIEPKTERGVLKMSQAIRFIAAERKHDELVKILASDNPALGISKLKDCGLLQYILPELLEGAGMKQNHHHIHDIYTHNFLALKNCPSPKWQVRFASLLHDIGKPKSMKVIDGSRTFYNHEYIGAKITKKIVERLKFSREDSEMIINLVRNHMFYYNVGEVTEASVRRLIAKTGKENLKDLIDLRIADRLGSADNIKAKPYKLRHLEYMFEKVQNDPVSVKMLKINGNDIMEKLNEAPGPKIGAILEVLLSEVLEDKDLNNKKHLMSRAKALRKEELAALRLKAQEVISEQRIEDDKKIKQQFKV